MANVFPCQINVILSYRVTTNQGLVKRTHQWHVNLLFLCGIFGIGKNQQTWSSITQRGSNINTKDTTAIVKPCQINAMVYYRMTRKHGAKERERTSGTPIKMNVVLVSW